MCRSSKFHTYACMTGNVLFTALDKLKPKNEAFPDMLPPSREGPGLSSASRAACRGRWNRHLHFLPVGVGTSTPGPVNRSSQGSAVSFCPRDPWHRPSSGGGWYGYPRSRDPFQVTRRTLLRAHCPLYVGNDSAQREILEPDHCVPSAVRPLGKMGGGRPSLVPRWRPRRASLAWSVH